MRPRSLPPVRALLVLAALAVPGGCGGEHSGLPSTADPLWTYSGHALLSAVASGIDGILLVIAESPSRLVALDLASGRLLWTVEAGGRNVVSGGGVTLAQQSSTFDRDPAELVALDTRTGSELWRTSRWRAFPAPRLAGGVAVGLTTDRTFEAVDARTGEPVFVYEPPGKQTGAPKAPYQDDPNDAAAWRATALTEGGELVYRGAEAKLTVVDLRAKSVTDVPAAEAGRPTGIAAVGERVVVVGVPDRAAGAGADAYTIEAFDAAARARLWSRRVAGLSAESVEMGSGNAVFVLESRAGVQGSLSLRAYDVATGAELWPEPLGCSDRRSVWFGGQFAGHALVREGQRLRAYTAPPWSPAWEADTGDAGADGARLSAWKNVVLMLSDTTTRRFAGSFVSESRITAFDLDTGTLLWRFVGDEVRSVTPAEDLVIGVGSNRVVALPLAPRPPRRWWPW